MISQHDNEKVKHDQKRRRTESLPISTHFDDGSEPDQFQNDEKRTKSRVLQIDPSGRLELIINYRDVPHSIRFTTNTSDEAILDAVHQICRLVPDPLEKENEHQSIDFDNRILIVESPSSSSSSIIAESIFDPNGRLATNEHPMRSHLESCILKAISDIKERAPTYTMTLNITEKSSGKTFLEKERGTVIVPLAERKPTNLANQPTHDNNRSSNVSTITTSDTTTLDTSDYNEDCTFPCGIIGLKNLKNTCYANSVIQSLNNCTYYRRFFERLKPSKLIGNAEKERKMVSLEMKKLLSNMWMGDSPILSPLALLTSIQQKQNTGQLEIGVEEDAHWFLQILLEMIDKEMSQAHTLYSPVSELFESEKAKEFFCRNCNTVVMADKPVKSFINTLCFPPKDEEDKEHNNVCSLEECLEFSTKLEGTFHTIRCQTCSSVCDEHIVTKKSPKILCFHFNRYRWTGRVINRATRSGAKGKISTQVRFPLQFGLESRSDLGPTHSPNASDEEDSENPPSESQSESSTVQYQTAPPSIPSSVNKNSQNVKNSNSQKTVNLNSGRANINRMKPVSNYKLTAVVIHEGLTPVTGHYTALSYNSILDKWFKFDDDKTPQEVNEQTVLKANPFLLFYQKS